MVSVDSVALMAEESFTDRLRRAMAAREMGVVALDEALGKKVGYTSTLLGREGTPKVDTAAEIAKALRVRLDWLATGEGPMEPLALAVSNDADPTSSGRAPLTFRDLPGWAEAVAKAKRRYRRIPEVAWIGAGLQAAQNVNEYIDEAVVLNFAKSWLTGSTDDERAAAAEAEGRAAMAEEDEAYRQKLLAFDNPPPPKARKPRAPKTKATAKLLRQQRGFMSLLTPQKVRYIFEGQAWRARLEPPNYTLRECDQIADEITQAGGRPTDFPNPLGLALGLRYRPVPGSVPDSGGDLCDGYQIIYEPSPDPRVQGVRILHPIVHNWVMRRWMDANEGACWLITGSLAVPWKYRLWTVDQVMQVQRHVPKWLIETRLYTLWTMKADAAE